MSETRQTFKAKVTGVGSETRQKSNGGEYVLQNCIITEGPLAGKTVLGTRTTKNADGKTKEQVPVNTEVQLFLTRVESTNGEGMFNFFEISAGLTASQDELNALLDQGNVALVQNAMDAQAI